MFRPILDSSARCNYIPELMFTLGFELSTVLFKLRRVIHLE
ncbi:unnamed protein product [Schistosoma curassoni]|uniref:Uncharacterized protein n=1 Tax=Schistosoma curassoni TaxID=6186 RepID=A0A183KAK6_9TREM|nr:unnamed protein product [Schistosoma curassoni]